MQSKGSIGFLEAHDGCGFWSIFRDCKETYSICYIFQDWEIWLINAWLARISNYFELDENAFSTALERCALFLDKAGCARPYRWIVGLEGIENRQLVILGRNKASGSCVADCIQDEGVYQRDDKAAELLQAFFGKVFDYCGESRPSPPLK